MEEGKDGRKPAYLFLALLLPVLIFLFLKFFGRNEFNVPLIHEDKLPAPLGCDFKYDAPYRLPDSLMQTLASQSTASLYLMNFSAAEPVENRVYNEFTRADVGIIPGSVMGERDVLRRCVLIAPPETDLVLIDQDKRVRGYYESRDQDEMDRLVVELKILLKKY